ncbi:C3 and PZP-like alpha-2-macroglobulin domain-containing protein 8 [Diadema antillarum]|uniref:C3 and PZP-like alpha-2-macroglobulin domain-containing protein 8 n=1 Tax=Diadema antillarum TaxID=105358 RepID=UPI003A87A0EA
MTSLDFEVSANHDVYMGLSSINRREPDIYEILIGCWGNNQSFIRQCPESNVSGYCEPTVREITPNILSGYGIYDRFWITFDNSTIAVGRHGTSTPFMEATYPAPVDINYVGVFTAYGSDGYWKFHSFC